MACSKATVEVDNPSVLHRKLCRHFGHKVEASFDDDTGQVKFPFGTVDFTSTDRILTIVVTAEDEQGVATGRDVIGSHLVRFAPRDDVELNWS